MTSNSLDIYPIAGALGAEIGVADLAEDLDARAIAAIRRPCSTSEKDAAIVLPSSGAGPDPRQP